MNEALRAAAEAAHLLDDARVTLRLKFGLACAERVSHLLDDPCATHGLATLRAWKRAAPRPRLKRRAPSSPRWHAAIRVPGRWAAARTLQCPRHTPSRVRSPGVRSKRLITPHRWCTPTAATQSQTHRRSRMNSDANWLNSNGWLTARLEAIAGFSVTPTDHPRAAGALSLTHAARAAALMEHEARPTAPDTRVQLSSATMPVPGSQILPMSSRTSRTTKSSPSPPDGA